MYIPPHYSALEKALHLPLGIGQSWQGVVIALKLVKMHYHSCTRGFVSGIVTGSILTPGIALKICFHVYFVYII